MCWLVSSYCARRDLPSRGHSQIHWSKHTTDCQKKWQTSLPLSIWLWIDACFCIALEVVIRYTTTIHRGAYFSWLLLMIGPSLLQIEKAAERKNLQTALGTVKECSIADGQQSNDREEHCHCWHSCNKCNIVVWLHRFMRALSLFHTATIEYFEFTHCHHSESSSRICLGLRRSLHLTDKGDNRMFQLCPMSESWLK